MVLLSVIRRWRRCLRDLPASTLSQKTKAIFRLASSSYADAGDLADRDLRRVARYRPQGR